MQHNLSRNRKFNEKIIGHKKSLIVWEQYLHSQKLRAHTGLNMASEETKVGVVGAGLIGMSWAGLFSAFGYETIVYDPHLNSKV